jgi:hypothetical protein
MNRGRGADAAPLRVTKKLSPQSKGAIKLTHQFGAALVCVRHRVDARGEFRYTTVELLVDKTPIRPRVETQVALQIELTERSLQGAVRAAGARWDSKARVWRMSKRLAGILRLTNRIVEK